MTYIDAQLRLPEVVQVPDNWVVTWQFDDYRSGEPVRVIRWEPPASEASEGIQPRTLGGSQMSVVLGRGQRLISFRRFCLSESALVSVLAGENGVPDLEESAQIAAEVMAAVDARSARHSHAMRVERQTRSWRHNGAKIEVPVNWHKFAAPSGGFSWVSVGPCGEVLEFERDAQWDFREWRRASEQWDHDGWIAAREGIGPQLDPPAARA